MSGTAVCPTCGADVSPGARFCASCGTALSAASPEERKLATILFADVIGSTDLGDQLDPERLRALLHDYFSAMARVVGTWGGTIEKYIGDAILAVWGVPAAREDDPIRALHAAREMLVELDALNDTLEARHGVRLAMRVGVNTGEVLAPLGAQPGGQFLVSGDAVNVAARLEQVAEPGTVLVGERTWQAARPAFEFSAPSNVELKGKREPVVARSLGRTIADGGREQIRTFKAPMLGRDRELSTVVGLLDEAIETRRPRLVLITGPAGIGKSRLLRELIASAEGSVPDVMVLRGRCLQTGRGITFWPLAEILRQLCGISLGEPAENAAEKLERRTAGPLAAVGLGQDEIRATIGAVAMSANLPLATNPLDGADPEEVAEQMSRAWPRLLTGLGRSRPLLVLIEDVHWADEPMLRMIEQIATRADGPLLVVATARPEFLETNGGFGAGSDVSVVALRPLTDAQSERLIAELLSSAQLPRSLVEEIRRKADGNPFFVEELIQRLIDEGALAQVDGRWQATDKAADVRLPDTIHALLAARIDALPADEKRLIQEAAVVGRVFWPGAVAEPGRDAESLETLRRLERRGLVAVRPTSSIATEPEYIFRHVLIRDVAYASVPRRRRAAAHAQTGRWIEQLAGDRLDELAELMAFHYSAAVSGDDADLAWEQDAAGRDDVRARAVEMLIRAGTAARRRFAVDKALELHEQAAVLAATDSERLSAHEELGDDHEALFHGDGAVREYLAAHQVVARPSPGGHRIGESAAVDHAAEARARLAAKAGRMVLRWGTFQGEPPLERIQSLVDESLQEPISDRARATLLMVNGGLLPSANGVPIAARRSEMRREPPERFADRVSSIREGLDLARRLDDVELLYFGNDLLSIAYQTTGDYKRMREAAEQQSDLLDRLGSVRQQVDALVSIASVRTDSGAYDRALAAAQDGFQRSVGLSPHERMHVAYEIVGAAEPSGQWDTVVEILPWFAASADAEGDISCASVRAGPPFAATVVARRGDLETARRLVPIVDRSDVEGTFVAAAHSANLASLTESRDAARRISEFALTQTDRGFLELGVLPMLEALARLEMFDELAAFVETALTRAGAVSTIEPAIKRGRAILALRSGETAQAETHLREALAQFEELGTPYEIAQTQEMLARVVAEPERSALLHEALAHCAALGARPLAALIEQALVGSGEPLVH